ncbi:ATP-grasp domain-containing protein [Actinophytocola sp.]|uniref:ATP-grasp domain-containing protein n=1 Tax=Actinophytocola sp. TaxID=1872138 RepID=UPI00389B2CAC
MNGPWFVLVESNTTGTGRDFAVAASRRGLTPVMVARDPRRYPYVAELALPVVEVDTANPDVVEAACRRLGAPGPVGITSSSEYFVRTAAVVAQRLGLRGQDPDAIALCRDKSAQRRRLRDAGVPVPDFVPCATAAAAAAAARSLGGPVVVKPVSGSGSEGVRRCANPGAARWWAARLLADRRRFPAGRLLVEREVRGPEYSVEIVDGVPVGITRKHLGRPPYFVETGHDYPAPLPAEQAAALADTAVRSVRAVGHVVGPAHVELRLAGVPTVIEINPRLPGGLIPRLVRHAVGRDLVDEVVAAAAGIPAADPVPGAGFAAIRFLLPPRQGVVAEVSGLDRARQLPGVVDVSCVLEPGADIRFTHSFTDRKGHAIGVGDHAAGAIAAAELALAELRLTYTDEVAAATAV